MTLTAYSHAFLPEGRTVFGVPLQPLCIGHALLLHRLQSPLVTSAGGKAGKRESETGAPASAPSLSPSHSPTFPPAPLPGLGDLLLALEICRQPGMQLPSRGRMKWLGLGQLRLTQRQQLRLEARYLDGLRDFRAYWHDAFANVPGVWEPKDAPRDAGVPLLVGLKVRLMGWLHYSEAQALATPITRARWDILAHSALEANVQLHTAEEEALIAAGRQGGGPKITLTAGDADEEQPAASPSAALAALAQSAIGNPQSAIPAHG